MAPTEKDRFGEKMRDVEQARENQYFADLDRKLIEERRRKEQETTAQTAIDQIKEAAKDRCPRDGERLTKHELHGVAVDSCPACEGMWLDKGELEIIAGRENEGWVSRWLRYEFRSKEKE